MEPERRAAPGRRVRMLVEGDVTDAKPVKFASRAAYERFMRQGIEIYEYQPAMMHAKAIIVDGVLSIVGSANFDNRSLELNDELNIVGLRPRRSRRACAQTSRADLTRSKRLDLESGARARCTSEAREKIWSYFGEVF